MSRGITRLFVSRANDRLHHSSSAPYGLGCQILVRRRWPRENPDVAELVDSNDRRRLADELKALSWDRQRRIELAMRALNVGMRFFSHNAAWNTLRDALAGVGA